MKFRLYSSVAIALTGVAYFLCCLMVAFVFYGYITVWAHYRWSDANNPPNSTPYYAGVLSADEQSQTYMFQSFQYYLINHDFFLIAPLVLYFGLTISEADSNFLYASFSIINVLWIVIEIVSLIILLPAYADCRNFWYCRMYNASAPAVEFVTLLALTGVGIGLGAINIIWSQSMRSEMDSMKARELALYGRV
jgi:hypothetical protein